MATAEEVLIFDVNEVLRPPDGRDVRLHSAVIPSVASHENRDNSPGTADAANGDASWQHNLCTDAQKLATEGTLA